MKEIKEFADFSGTNGYLIIDGEDQNTEGGKIKFPNYSGVNITDGAVLTKSTTNNEEVIGWQVPAGGGWSYTQASSTFGPKQELPFPGEYFDQTTR